LRALEWLSPSFLRCAFVQPVPRKATRAARHPILAEGQGFRRNLNPAPKEGKTMTTTTLTAEPRIYVACLAAYNSGTLHGAWIDATQGEWGIWDDIQKMLAASPIPDAEEHAIHDYEGFEGARIEEYTGIETVAKLAAFITEHGALGGAVLAHYNNDLDEATEAMTERYLGAYKSLTDYIQEVTEDSITIPQALQYYINWQAMAYDAEINGHVLTINTAYDEVHVFAGG
jgi:antirestriction protein